MLIEQTSLHGVFLISEERILDDRGYFARTFCRDEMTAAGLVSVFSQDSVASTIHRASIRGLHYSAASVGETKLIRCVQGRIFDVVVDLRPNSPSYLAHRAFELDGTGGKALYVSRGFAHGYQTLTDAALVSYRIDIAYRPEDARGIRYDDPNIGIGWPLPVSVVSEKDAGLPYLSEVVIA